MDEHQRNLQAGLELKSVQQERVWRQRRKRRCLVLLAFVVCANVAITVVGEGGLVAVLLVVESTLAVLVYLPRFYSPPPVLSCPAEPDRYVPAVPVGVKIPFPWALFVIANVLVIANALLFLKTPVEPPSAKSAQPSAAASTSSSTAPGNIAGSAPQPPASIVPASSVNEAGRP